MQASDASCKWPIGKLPVMHMTRPYAANVEKQNSVRDAAPKEVVRS